MKEYIDKLDALECVKLTPIASTEAVEEEFIDAWVDGTSDATRAIYKSITSLPAADVVERKRGEWEVWEEDAKFFACSCCGQVVSPMCVHWFHFCPNCGADMREVDHEGVH